MRTRSRYPCAAGSEDRRGGHAGVVSETMTMLCAISLHNPFEFRTSLLSMFLRIALLNAQRQHLPLQTVSNSTLPLPR